MSINRESYQVIRRDFQIVKLELDTCMEVQRKINKKVKKNIESIKIKHFNCKGRIFVILDKNNNLFTPKMHETVDIQPSVFKKLKNLGSAADHFLIKITSKGVDVNYGSLKPILSVEESKTIEELIRNKDKTELNKIVNNEREKHLNDKLWDNIRGSLNGSLNGSLKSSLNGSLKSSPALKRGVGSNVNVGADDNSSSDSISNDDLDSDVEPKQKIDLIGDSDES